MTIKEYKEEFIKLCKQMIDEHGRIQEVRITDDTQRLQYNNALPSNFDGIVINCNIIFG